MRIRKEMGKNLEDHKKIRIGIPGIQTLHSRPLGEIGEILSQIISSEENITEIKYVLGKYIELVVDATPPGHIVSNQVY